MIGVDTDFLVRVEVTGAARHQETNALLDLHATQPGFKLAFVPQVLAEFQHVVTDPRRFSQPLSMAEALKRTSFWWDAAEAYRLFPNAEAMRLHHEWMARHGLGRKRILDTLLAATLHTAGVRRLFTTNPDDFRIFGVFELLVP